MMSRRIVTPIVALLLLAIFIFPARFLAEWCEDMDSYAQQAQSCIVAGRPAEARAYIEHIRHTFDQSKGFAKLMLNHEDIDDMDAYIRQASAAIMLDEPVEAAVALASLITSLEYIQKIERFSWVNLI